MLIWLLVIMALQLESGNIADIASLTIIPAVVDVNELYLDASTIMECAWRLLLHFTLQMQALLLE